MRQPLDRYETRWLQRAYGRRTDGVRMPRRDVGDAHRADELRLLEAWIKASQLDSVWKAIAQFESAWMRIRDEIARRERTLGTIADLYLPEDVDPVLRQLFALPSHRALAVLLGEREESGAYRSGFADLSESEYDALMLWLTPLEETDERGFIALRVREDWEIARDMTPKRSRYRFGRRAWLKEETAKRYLRSARSKLRTLFGLANPLPSVP